MKALETFVHAVRPHLHRHGIQPLKSLPMVAFDRRYENMSSRGQVDIAMLENERFWLCR